ncbi:UDP-N-acetylmuramoyl-tripeptide--D-alanyl-D-alanine ligase [Candidatus Nitrotoga sp. M5]|uniref:UDP-N-acetylmuramoyl-tripeptide--D-alanyl-D- alanine ligase n=1 Tax=Candidatus Nitrotoga sp. M5 TaxID=2890409 RepID=UPI001EF4B547|nr:UDP-N-acetylmuramoyl-tripeptide--D-alanyl-D-alanine ligase [Candidatus Nitrotoga sp. M5]CAH1388147.1 D-alanyl-D-alanine-adding enzyme [Candidatus Nitrotoga sp. M5]
MMLLSQVAHVLGCKLVGHDTSFTSVSSDSRAIKAGDLFVALQGENFDGSAFVAGATESGAVAALINTTSYREAASPCPLLLVEDTRLALGHLAAYWRTQLNIPVIAITGSNGKTTVKEMLASILRTATDDDDAVLATLGNLNNDIGVPLTLLKLRAAHRYAVIEMGMNHQGEIEYLTRMARPDVAIVNNAGSAHLAGLGSVAAVARAKGEIFTGLSPQGTAIINADDVYAPLWRELADDHKIIEFSLEKNAAVHAQWQVKDKGMYIEVSTPQGNFNAQLQVPGAHNVRNALAATAAALALHVPLLAIATGLEAFSGVAARLQRKTALHGAMLIDDSYNANPTSLHAALEVLAQRSGKKILVLGDMGELGENAVRLHSEIGTEAQRLGVTQLLALGKLTVHAVHKFGTGAHHFEHIEDLFAVLDKILDSDSTVLVKGSRFMRMERVVQHCTGTNELKEEKSREDPMHKRHHPSLTHPF